jgi:hypothetical protein
MELVDVAIIDRKSGKTRRVEYHCSQSIELPFVILSSGAQTRICSRVSASLVGTVPLHEAQCYHPTAWVSRDLV